MSTTGRTGDRTSTHTRDRAFARTLNGSMVGAVLEWYDFAVYGALAATVLAGQFFPKFDPQAGLLLAFGTQAVGFAARPLGGIVFGHIGDRKGRKPAFIMTYLLLGVATACIGLLPTYATWGIAAPLLLVVLRFVQGFALGGEFGAAITLVSEHSTPRNRGFWVSIPQTGGPAGTLLGAGMLAVIGAVVGPEAFQAWGWRVAFLIAIPLLLVGAWMRRGVEESPIFTQARERPVEGAPSGSAEQFRPEHGQSGLRAALRNPVPILQGLGVRLGENVAFYVYTVFVVAYATKFLGYPTPPVLLLVTVASAFQLVGMLLGGWLSDRVGRRPVMMTAALVLGGWAPVFFWLAGQHSLGLLALGVCTGAFVHGVLAGPEAAWIAELFPTAHRTAGTSLAVQGSSIFGGGPAPLVATALLGSAWGTTGVVVYLVACAALSFVAVLSGPETRGTDLR